MMSYQAITVPDSVTDSEAEPRPARSLSPLVAVALLAVGAFAGVLYTHQVASVPALRASGMDGTSWLQFTVSGQCTEYDHDDEEKWYWTCLDMKSSDGAYQMKLIDGYFEGVKDAHANWTLTTSDGTMAFEGRGIVKAEHGADDFTESFGGVTGRIRDATGDYAGCQGAISITFFSDNITMVDDGSFTFQNEWSVSVMYEWI